MKRLIAIVLVVGLGLLSGGAAAAPKPVIEDPLNDANFLNDQGTADGTFGDFAGPADASGFADILSVTFTSDAKNVYVHIETESTAPPAAGEGFRVRTNPEGAGGTYCLHFEALYNGAQNDMTTPAGHLRDACGGETIEGTVSISPLGGLMIVIPRKAHKGLAKGATLSAPQAASFLWSGSYPNGVAGPYLDTTKVGTDHKLK